MGSLGSLVGAGRCAAAHVPAFLLRQPLPGERRAAGGNPDSQLHVPTAGYGCGPAVPGAPHASADRQHQGRDARTRGRAGATPAASPADPGTTPGTRAADAGEAATA